MSDRCLDLFSGLGGFSSAFEESDQWEVTTVDLNPEFDADIQKDILELEPDDLPAPDVVLASPPCVDFSVACITQKWEYDQNRRPMHLPRLSQIADSIKTVFHTLWLIYELNPEYWFLENPQGMLSQWLGTPMGTVNYCQYGSDFKKPTQLWGCHPPLEYKTCPGRRLCGHVSNPNDANNFRDETRSTEAISYSAERAKVPRELSNDILEAVERAFENPPPEQTTLP